MKNDHNLSDIKKQKGLLTILETRSLKSGHHPSILPP